MSKFKIGDIAVGTAAASERYSITTEGVRVSIVNLDPFTVKVLHGSNSGLRFEVNSNYFRKISDGGDMTKPYERRTFKQLIETPTVRKNALWQEACDDGTQEYKLLNTTDSKDGERQQSVYNRSLIEDNKSFVEVFKVLPAYMTREELDQWEAFKGRKTAKAPRANATTSLGGGRLTTSRLEEVGKYASENGTAAAAEMFNVTRGTANTYMWRYKKLAPKPTRQTTRRARGVSTERFVAVYNSSRSSASVAKKLHITVGAVYARANKARAAGHQLKRLKGSQYHA